MKYPLFSISLAILIGIVISSFLPSNVIIFRIILISAPMALLLTFIFFKNKIISHIFLYLLVFLTGFIRFAAFNELPKNHIRFIVTEEPKRMTLKGTISSNPVFRRKFGHYPELEFLLKTNYVGQSHLRGGTDKWLGVTGLVLVKSYFSGTERFEYGDKVFVRGKVALPREAGDFNYRRYLADRKIYAVCKIEKGGLIKKVGSLGGPVVSTKRFLYSIKGEAEKAVQVNLKPPHSGVLIAMILGERHDLDRFTKDLFIKTGTMHILAISGLHVGIIIFILLGIFKLVHIPKKWSYFCTMIIIFFYALMIGKRPSVWRATIMAEIFLLGFILDRKPNFLNMFSLALLILILANPNYIFDVGFILSFVCIASIIWITPITDVLFKISSRKPITEHRKSKTAFYILKSLSISTSVWIGILPIIAYYFHIITPITIFANLIAIPAAFIIVSLGITALFFNPLIPGLSIIFYESIWFVDNIMFFTLKYFSNLNIAYIQVKNFSFFYILIYYAFLIALINTVRKKIVTFL